MPSALNSYRILVTGGAGFIGSHCCQRFLRDGWERVVALDDFNDYYAPAVKRANVAATADDHRFRLVEGSFVDAATLDRLFDEHRFTHVLHLGGYAGVTPSLAKPLLYVETNVVGTARLLEACRQRSIERFVLASSSTVYGRGATAPFVEDAPLGEPLSPYGATKQAAESWTALYHRTFAVPTVRLRFFNVYGSRMRPDLALSIFARKMLEGEPFPLYGDGSVRRDFTHITDVCDGIVAALAKPSAIGHAINLGHDEPIEIRELIARLEKALDRKARIDRRPARAEDMPVTHANLGKARSLLDYSPKTSLDAGLAEFATWLRG